MITKHDWNEALDGWIDEERERLGGPPSPEDVVAYLSGELSPAEAARVRALLVYYPELTPLLTERIEKPRVSRRPVALGLYAAAATVAMAVFSTVLVQHQRRESEPVAISAHYEFRPLLTRGPAVAYEVAGGQRRYLMTVIPSGPPAESEYALEISRASRVVWRAEHVRPIGDAFVLDIPGKFLTPGTYVLKVRAGARLIDHYAFRVTE